MQTFDKEKLRKAQLAALGILISVDRICREEGIQYLLDAGTLIGAVRHKGFIPWDDDLDIAMTRDNFNRFTEALKRREKTGTGLDSNMELVMPWNYNGGKAFYDFTPRIILLNSKVNKDPKEMAYYSGKLDHLWLDIFILDRIPDNKLLDKWTRFKQMAIYGMSMPHRYKTRYSKYSFSDKIKVFILSLMSVMFSMDSLFKMQKKLSEKYNRRKTENLYYSNYQPDYLHDTVKREWSEKVIDMEFEGHMFMAPSGYDNVLKEVYGDYMTMPPMDKRKPSHGDVPDVW